MAADRLPLLSNNICSDICDSEFENKRFTHTSLLDREENLSCTESEDSQNSLQDDEHSDVQVLPLQPDKKYHLFISYSSEDRDDANEICGCMEQRFQMKCMNFERDFVPGKNIDDNIADNMRKSVKVLIILSPNYLQSHWCVTEAREAAQLSFTGPDVNVIPLLLRPLAEDLNVPPFLKSLVYIDAQREFDVPAKIYEAYLNPGSSDPLHKKRNGESRNTYNGTFLCQKFASKAKFLDHGNSYRFYPLEDHEKEKIASLDLSTIESANHFNVIIDELNSRTLFRNYPSFASKWRFLLVFAMILLTVIIFAGFGIILREGPFFAILGLAASILLICPCSLCSMYLCRKDNKQLQKVIDTGALPKQFKPGKYTGNSKDSGNWKDKTLSSSVHTIVFRLNVKFYQKSKCLIFYDDSIVSKPTLNIFKYDTNECRNYVCVMLKKKRPRMNENDIKETADYLIERQLEYLQQRNGLIKWTSLPESASKRHRTRNDRACLCEMVEDSINKDNGGTFSNKGVIEV
ncbi:uncharacterized protein LOC134238619 [Saccostrea cucullata]|uniref:uncharacterized protein LOC134238619 n=1 Tax=Saccostrea cuccullata TaxID=36930 RepID=UPI002ED6657F